jgi:hypothetical protein
LTVTYSTYWEMRNVYKIYLRKPDGNIPYERSKINDLIQINFFSEHWMKLGTRMVLV